MKLRFIIFFILLLNSTLSGVNILSSPCYETPQLLLSNRKLNVGVLIDFARPPCCSLRSKRNRGLNQVKVKKDEVVPVFN
jgi:hypothetical protein